MLVTQKTAVERPWRYCTNINNRELGLAKEAGNLLGIREVYLAFRISQPKQVRKVGKKGKISEYTF